MLWAIPVLFFSFFFFYPLYSVFERAFSGLVAFRINTADLLRIGRILSFTIWQATLSTLLTLCAGLPGAYVFAHYSFRGKKILENLFTLPFILPTVVVAASLNALLGSRGWLNLGLMNLFNLSIPPINILNTLWAILLAHVFYNTSVIIRIVGGAWGQMDQRYQQAARVLGATPWTTLREITLPLLKPAIFSATLLVFLFDFTSFGVILLLGGARYATTEVEIYIQAIHMLNLPLASLIAIIQMIFTLIIMSIYGKISHGNTGKEFQIIPRLHGETLRKPKTPQERILVMTIIAFLLILFILPLLGLGLRSISLPTMGINGQGTAGLSFTTEFYKELFVNRRSSYFYVPPIQAALNSLRFAFFTVLFSVPLGMLIAFNLKRRTRLTQIIDMIFMLPLGTSAVILGLGYVITFNQSWINLRSFPLAIPLVHTLIALPMVVRSIFPALQTIPDSLHQAAAVLGASPFRTWWEVDIPIIMRAILISTIFSFTISLGEFGATSFLARADTPTLPVAIFQFIGTPGAMNYGQSMAMATILLAICSFCIIIIDRLKE